MLDAERRKIEKLCVIAAVMGIAWGALVKDIWDEVFHG